MARRPRFLLRLARLVLLIVITEGVSGVRADDSSDDGGQAAAQQLQIQTLTKAASSRREANDARARLPLENLNAEFRQQAMEVVNDISVFRRLPSHRFEIEPDVYRFFVAHPDVAVSIWRVMEISKFEMWQTGPFSYEVDAGDGSTGICDVIYRDDDECIILCNGLYKSPLLRKPIECNGLMHLTYRFERDQNNTSYVTHDLSVFVAFPSNTITTAARMISPVTNVIMDRNFLEVSAFVRMMSLAMRNQPGWVENTARQMEGVLPQRRQELTQLTAQVYVADRKRRLLRKDPDANVTLEEIMSPLRVASNTTTGGIVESASRSAAIPVRTVAEMRGGD